MAEVLNLFPARIQFVNPDGTLTLQAYRALQTLMVRVGGPIAPTINELDAQQYADAGIEEGKASLFAFMRDMESTPQPDRPIQVENLVTEVASLREAISNLMTQINDINQRVEL